MNTWSSGEVLALVGAALAVLVATALLAAYVVRSGARRNRELTAALSRALSEAETRAGVLAQRVARLEEQDRGQGPATGRVLTGTVHDGWQEPVPERIDGRLFADLVARETTVKAAGLLHGLRVALSPQNRNRIRFEVRQEIKRSRKQRREDRKAAMRDLRARERRADEDAA